MKEYKDYAKITAHFDLAIEEAIKFGGDVGKHVVLLFETMRNELDTIPAADVAEVRHARWERVIPTKSAAKWSTKVSCSNCHGQGYERYKYCPRCGACMDKEE